MVSFVLEGQCTIGQGCGTTSLTNPLGKGNWDKSVGYGGGLRVCCPAGSSLLPARPIEEGRESPQGERDAGWGQRLRTALTGYRGGLPLGLQRRISLGTWQQ